jgi:dolichol kinase
VAVLAAGCAVALALELARARHGATRIVFTRVTGSLLRLHEHERWSGATWLLLAFLGAAVFAPREVAISAMWAIAVGDAAAAMVGRAAARRTGRRSRRVDGPNGSGKTLAGSAACFALTLAGALVVARVTVTEGLIAAAAATAAERPSTRLDDNLRVAAAVVGGILLWRIMFS